MSATEGVSVPEFNVVQWCARLAGTLEFLLDNPSENAAIVCRATLDEYDAQIASALAETPSPDNVVPFTRPVGFSIHHAIDEQLGRKPRL